MVPALSASVVPPAGSIPALNGVVTGLLDATDRRDSGSQAYAFEEYQLTGQVVGTPIRINLQAAFDAVLEILNADTREVVAWDQAWVDDSGPESQALLIFVPRAGLSYRVRVGGQNSADLGTFMLKTLPLVTPPLGGTIAAIQGVVTSSLDMADSENPALSGSFCEDYRITGVVPGTPIKVALEAGFDAYVQIINASTQEVVAWDDESGTGSNAQLIFTPLAGITYLARASSYFEAETGAFTLRTLPVNDPDLQVLSASAPASARVGELINVAWTVKNVGSAPMPEFWGDEIVLSTDSVYDHRDITVEWQGRQSNIALSPGDSYSQSLLISLPSTGVSGTNYLIFRANPYSDQIEISRDNNTFVLPISLDLNGPDLQLLSAFAPTNVTIGVSIDVSWTVKNIGADPAAGWWGDNVYLSKDPIYDFEDIFIASHFRDTQTPLVAGGSYTLNRSISVPSNGVSGRNYLIFRANPYPQQGEMSRANNDFSVPILLDLNGPDLRLLSASAPAATNVGALIDVSWTVQNVGLASANGDWIDYIYLSPDATYNYDDIYVDSFSVADQTPLAVGASYTLTRPISLPSTGIAGQNYLIFKTNIDSGQGETGMDNNIFILPVNLDLNGPDLQAVSATAPVTANAGAQINVSWSVKNNGTASAGADWTDEIYLSNDAFYDFNDVSISFFAAEIYSPLAPSASYTQNKSIVIPPTTLSGQYYLLFHANSGWLSTSTWQRETNENNNVFALPIAIANTSPTLPVVALTASPTPVLEDGSANLTFTFSRTGSTTSPLVVSFNIGGSASLSAGDYTQQGASGFTGTSGSATFASGSTTAIVTVDPTADTAQEGDETVLFTLAASPTYTIGTTAAATGTILNDDTYATLENQGNTTLLRRSDGLAYVQTSGGSPRAITLNGATIQAGTDTSAWQMLAAETTGAVNRVLWRNNPGNSLYLWRMDANWGWQASEAVINPSSPDAWTQESNFQLELNGDATIGIPYIKVEDKGNTTLLRRGDGLASVQTAGGSPRPITLQGATIQAGTDTSAWQMLAAETVGGVNRVLWRNHPANSLYLWAMDGNWGWQASEAVISPASPDAWTQESNFQLDLNGDATIGIPYIKVEDKGNTTLLRRGDGLAHVQTGGGSPRSITLQGATIQAGTDTSAWQMLAAETTGGVNRVLWRNNPANSLYLWAMDGNWGWQASEAVINPASPDAWTQESNFQLDLNGDATIGIPYVTVEANGNTTLLRRGDGLAYVQTGGGSPRAITLQGATIQAGTDTSDWQMLAAETTGGVNRVLWRNNPANSLYLWAMDGNWGWQASEAVINPASAEAWAQESNFQLDLNGDSIIGLPFSTVEANGTTTLLRRADGLAYVQPSGSSQRPITLQGAPIQAGTASSDWQMLAAETTGGVNRVLWRNNPANALYLWAMDGNWGWQASEANVLAASAQGSALLSQFGLGGLAAA